MTRVATSYLLLALVSVSLLAASLGGGFFDGS